MTAAERVYHQIKQRILDGQCPQGTYIREASIGREFGMSRTPIREALRQLVSEGWAQMIPHHGARVIEWTQRDVDEVFELRALLEPYMVKRATALITRQQLDKLSELADGMEVAVSNGGDEALDDVAGLNSQFHARLMTAAGSPRLQRMLEAVVQLPVSRRSFHQYTPEELQRSMQHHRELIRALSAGDAAWAEAVMRAHVLAARTAQSRLPRTLSEIGATDAER